MYEEEELYWHQRSNERWLLKGDNNTAFFHRVANGKRRRHFMHQLNHNNLVIEGTSNLINHATEYYKELFGPAPGNLFSILEELWSVNERLNNLDNNCLIRPFTVQEVKAAMFSVKPNKAPGPDSIPIEFFQHCWDLVMPDVMFLFDSLHSGSLDVQRLNYGIITLLPKLVGANKIQ